MNRRFSRRIPLSALDDVAGLLGLATLCFVLSLSLPGLLHAQGSQPASASQAPAAGGGNQGMGAGGDSTKAMLDAYAKVAQPGEHHKRLDGLVGKWKVSGKAWMGPGASQDWSGTSEATWILGGRYLQQVHKSTFMGQPFEGRSIDGYDNASHEFFSTWIDTMGTGVEVFRGACDASCNVLTETAEVADPVTGKKGASREVITFLDPNTYRLEMYMVGGGPGGQDLKVMEMTATREK